MLGTLLGNYRVVQRLGEGGAGVTYIGRHEALGHRALVKLLRAELSSNRSLVQRMFREAEAASAIRNRGIAQVLDFGVASDGRAYIVSELLEGESLAARLEHGRRDAADACRLGRQVASVLHVAHAAGIIHRDLKPDSLFLVADPEVIGGECIKVLDFGIGKLVGDVRAAGAKTVANLGLGTPDYMAPEQCRSAGAADVRSDIYSLGCILFELTCGRAPFASSNIGDIVAAQLYDPPPHPLSVVPDLPPRLAALILRLLAKHPDARPQTMETVSQALGEILQTLDAASAQARPSPSPLPATLPTAASASPSAGPSPASSARRSPSPASPSTVTTPAGGSSSVPAALTATTPAGASSSPASPTTVATSANRSPSPASSARPSPSPTSSTTVTTPTGASPSPPGPSQVTTPAGQPSAPSAEPAAARRGRAARAASPSPLHAAAFPVSLSPESVMVIEPTRKTRPRRRRDTRRMLFMAGSVVCAGVVGAVVFLLAFGHSSSAGKLAASNEIAASRVVEPARDPGGVSPILAPSAPEAPTVPLEAPAVASPPAPAPAPSTTDPAPTSNASDPALKPSAADAMPTSSAATAAAGKPAPTDTADSIARECSGHLMTRHWPSLAQCADRLKPLDAARAAELKARATEETRSAPHSTAAAAALRDHNLKLAKVELDQVWSGSVELAALKRSYDVAEAKEIDALATELDSLRDSSCNAFHERLSAVRTKTPVRVLAEVTHRVRCVPQPAASPKPAAPPQPAASPQPASPRPTCDADALAGEGGRQFSAGHLAESLAAYEAAYACEPSGTLLQKQLVVACNLHDEPRAKGLWKRLSEPQRTSSLLAICIRNGLPEGTLSAP